MSKKKIAILTGGDSSERDVALSSAKNVISVLENKYELAVFDLPKDLNKFLVSYKNFQAAVPVFHGSGGEDGIIQGFLKTLHIPFIFSDVEAHALGMDKSICKFLAEKEGILTSPYQILYENKKINYQKISVVKPLAGGSSIGIEIVDNQKSLNEAIDNAFKYSDKVLIEDYISGEEFTVPIIDKNGQSFALPVIQIKSKNKFFDFESKYDPSLSEEICPAPIDKKLSIALQEKALKMHQIIGARHISRSDFIVSGTNIYFLEINTIPGMTNESLFPKAIKAAGEDFGQLLSNWIEDL